MNFTVGFVSQNLVTQTNFVKFRGSRIFQEFRDDGYFVDPKNGILRNKILKLENKLDKVHRI